MEENLKQLLLIDLCHKLPYGIKCSYRGSEEEGIVFDILGINSNGLVCLESNFVHVHSLDSLEMIKPYLRPMSSMTEEEKRIMDNLWKDNNKLVFADPSEIRRYRFYDISVVDFLNSHHFDYRGLIPMGLALEAPKDMYNTKTE